MTDLENNISPATDNSGNINPNITQSNETNVNLGEVNLLNQTPSLEPSQIETTDENQQEFTPTETPNNEIILGKFDNAMINTFQEQETAPQQDISLTEQPITQETSMNEEIRIENQPKSKLAQKEKLLQLIKVHESKAKSKGFTTGILSGIVLSVGIVALSFVFTKDQIINLLSGENENSSLSANVVDLNINNLENENYEDSENILSENNEKIDDTEINEEEIYDDEDYEDENEEFDTSIYNENSEDLDTIYENTENILPENDEEEINNERIYDDENDENDEYINEEIQTPIYNENLNENSEATGNILPENDEEINNENTTNVETKSSKDKEENDEEKVIPEYNNSSKEETPKYSIIAANSTGEANWVLPAHCSDLTCYGEDKEFTPCTTFKLVESLDENANRIGNNGTCRYKDASELVYVEFN